MTFNQAIHHIVSAGLVFFLFVLLAMLVWGLWATRPWKDDNNAKFWKDNK